MSIVEELKKSIFEPSSDFLNKLSYKRNTYGGYEDTFLDLLAEKLHSKFPNYSMAISIRFKRITPSTFKRPEELLGIQRDKIRERICWPTWLDWECNKISRCFDGGFLQGNEVDALIVRNGRDFCFVEYERNRTELCDDFMKMYWLQQLFNTQFESLFVTTLTTKKPDGTYDEFARYVAHVKPFLDRLLQNWTIMEIVDLSWVRKRQIKWEPEESRAR